MLAVFERGCRGNYCDDTQEPINSSIFELAAMLSRRPPRGRRAMTHRGKTGWAQWARYLPWREVELERYSTRILSYTSFCSSHQIKVTVILTK